MKNFASLIHELSELAGIAIETDIHEAVKLRINQKIPVQIEAETTGESILLMSQFIELPPGRFRENILKDALKANHMSDQHPSVLSYILKHNQLVLFQHVHAHALTGELLYGHLTIFVKRVESWREAIDSGKTSPSGEFPLPKSKPNLFGFKP